MRTNSRSVFALGAVVSGALVVASVVLAEWLRLHPCPLCIFQRLLYMVIAVLSLGGALFPAARRFWALLLALTAAGGLATAIYQSWLQLAPAAANECGFGEPNLVERLVDWLGMQWPTMFLATGFCSSKEWEFLGLSIANWSVLAFAGFLAGALSLLRRRGR